MPAYLRKPEFESVDLVVFDFDGVFTDNKVYVSDTGAESVRCDRSDSLGLDFMRKAAIPMLVLSTEGNPVVARRCDKLKLECIQGVGDKESRLDAILIERNVSWDRVAYLGNDLNDENCMRRVGFAIAPADSHDRILNLADVRLSRKGGDGAIREFVERFIEV